VLPTHAPSGSDSDEDSDGGEKLPGLAFDFLINDRLLRTSVESAARREGVSLESAVKILYFPSRDIPEEDGETETLPDWITALSSCGDGGSDVGNGFVCAGGSDGWLRLYGKKDLAPFGTVKAHSGPIKAVDCRIGGKGNGIVASGSMDQTLVTHRYHKESGEFILHAIYGNGHGASINSLAMVGGDEDGLMASGDWSGGLCVWKVPGMEDAGDIVPSHGKKKKKTKDGPIRVEENTSSSSSVHEVAPLISLKAHSNDISGMAWGYETTSNSTTDSGKQILFTSSWDHSIKSWDIETQNNILTLNGSKVATCLTRCQNSNVVASGHPDCTVRLWDMRVSGKNSDGEGGFFDGTLRPSHNAWISAVKWSQDPYVLASASHDGTVKLWDIRSSLPLHTVRAHAKGEKALCLTVTEDAVYSGGSDCLVKKFKF